MPAREKKSRNNFFSKAQEAPASTSTEESKSVKKEERNYYNCKTEHLKWLIKRDSLSKEISGSPEKAPGKADPITLRTVTL